MIENKLVTVFLAENMRELFIDFANKKITDQDTFDFYWYKVFDEAIEIEKNQIKKAFEMGENTITLNAEEYYNETYLEEIDNENT